MISTKRHGIKELETSELESLRENADLLDKAIDHWGTASWNKSVLQIVSEVPAQELYIGLSISFMLPCTNPDSPAIKLDNFDEKSLLSSTGNNINSEFLTAEQIYTVTFDGTAFRIDNTVHADSSDDAKHADSADTAKNAADAKHAISAETSENATTAVNYAADGEIAAGFKEQSDALNKHLSDSLFKVAGGTATDIKIDMATPSTPSDGYSKTFIASADNNAAATTVNGKPLYKPNATVSPNLIKGKAYTIWYNVTGDSFFIKASAEGTAGAADVLSGKTASNDTDIGFQGTMPNKVGSGMVIVPGTADKTIPQGYYGGNLDDGIVKGDANLISNNIRQGTTVFGILGNMVPKQDFSSYILNLQNISTNYSPIGFSTDGLWCRNYPNDGKAYCFNSAGTIIKAITCSYNSSAIPISVSKADILWINIDGGNAIYVTDKSGAGVVTINAINVSVKLGAINSDTKMIYLADIQTVCAYDYSGNLVCKKSVTGNYPIIAVPIFGGCIISMFFYYQATSGSYEVNNYLLRDSGQIYNVGSGLFDTGKTSTILQLFSNAYI